MTATLDKRIVEIRLIVIVCVDIRDASLLDLVRARKERSLSDIVSSEVASNLESVPYVAAVVVSEL